VTDIPRGRHIGRRVGDPPKDEVEHFIRCPACEGWIDSRDLAQVLEHEGPAAPPCRRSTAVIPMPLKMRPTGLGHGV
jgi:hypothetical protein